MQLTMVRTFTGPMIDIYLPLHGKLFTVHRDVLVSRCHRLEWALLHDSDDDEGECVGISIACGTPESFGLILQWMYTSAVHQVKDVSEVLLHMDATLQALALGVRDALDPLCERVEDFYKHNVVNKTVVDAIEEMPDKCRLRTALIDITASDLCKSLRNPGVVSPDIFCSFLHAGGEPVVTLAVALAWNFNNEEDRNRHKDMISNRRTSLTAVEHGSRAIVQAHPDAIRNDGSQDNQCNYRYDFTTVALNFVPGTSAAEIRSAISHDSYDSKGHNCLMSCHLTCERPFVTAELVFSSRGVADRVLRKYHDQRADGRLLQIFGEWEADTAVSQNSHSKSQYSGSMQIKTKSASPEEVSTRREEASSGVPMFRAKRGSNKHNKNNHHATSFSPRKKDVTTTHASKDWDPYRRPDKTPEGHVW